MNRVFTLLAVIFLISLNMACDSSDGQEFEINNARVEDGLVILTGFILAPTGSIVLWQEWPSGSIDENGEFSISSNLIPRDCVGILQVVGVERINVRVENCVPDNRFLRLLTTGQIISFIKGDDGAIQEGREALEQRYRDNSDGTFTDLNTGLHWMTNVDCMKPVTWEEAHEMAVDMEDGHCGLQDGSIKGDWVVPNRAEIQTLFDFGGENSVIGDNNPITGIDLSLLYWTSTTHPVETNSAFGVYFGSGNVVSTDKSTAGGCLLKKLYHETVGKVKDDAKKEIKKEELEAASSVIGSFIAGVLVAKYSVPKDSASSSGKDIANTVINADTPGDAVEGVIDILTQLENDGHLELKEGETIPDVAQDLFKETDTALGRGEVGQEVDVLIGDAFAGQIQNTIEGGLGEFGGEGEVGGE